MRGSATLQIQVDGHWRDAAVLEIEDATRGRQGRCFIEYVFDYAREHMGDDRPDAAVSLAYPVVLGPEHAARWPAFLDDIRPMGHAHDWWKKRLALPDGANHDVTLLQMGTIAPIGNLRVKEAVPEKTAAPVRLSRQALIDRTTDLLEVAAAQGVVVGGATGAGGDAPKVLVRASDDGFVWFDTWQDEATRDRAFVVKFARGARTPRDRTILTSEFVYARALDALGIDSVAKEGHALTEGDMGPALWMPRFDIVRDDEGKETRKGVESVYALMGAEAGASLFHEDVLARLLDVVTTMTPRELTLEYLQREVLNLVFGNSDNHGRNMAVLKTRDGVSLAPIYDFAPMKMDLEGVTRSTRWRAFERGGEIDWTSLLASLGDDEAFIREELHALALKLVDVRALLGDLGLPDETLAFEPIGFARVREKLEHMGLL